MTKNILGNKYISTISISTLCPGGMYIFPHNSHKLKEMKRKKNLIFQIGEDTDRFGARKGKSWISSLQPNWE